MIGVYCSKSCVFMYKNVEWVRKIEWERDKGAKTPFVNIRIMRSEEKKNQPTRNFVTFTRGRKSAVPRERWCSGGRRGREEGGAWKAKERSCVKAARIVRKICHPSSSRYNPKRDAKTTNDGRDATGGGAVRESCSPYGPCSVCTAITVKLAVGLWRYFARVAGIREK